MNLNPAEPRNPVDVTELAQSRLSGESDLHFFARYCRQKIDRWIEAYSVTDTARENGANSEVMRKVEAAERHARFYMVGASELLYEALHPKQKSASQESQQ